MYKQLHLHISLPYPGVLRHTYEGEVVNIKLKNISDFRLSASKPFYFQFPNLPQLEDYHIIDSTDDHLLIIFCHGMPEANLNGALVKPIRFTIQYNVQCTFIFLKVLSRARTSSPDNQTLERFDVQIICCCTVFI